MELTLKPIIKCSYCGENFNKTNYNQIYCDSCSYDAANLQKIKYMNKNKSYFNNIRKKQSKDINSIYKSEIGYIYFILYENNLIKIGKTKNIRSRFMSLRSSSPSAIVNIYYFENKNGEDEKTYHIKFYRFKSTKPGHREFFHYNESIESELKKLKIKYGECDKSIFESFKKSYGISRQSKWRQKKKKEKYVKIIDIKNL